MSDLQKILIERDGLTESEANDLIAEAKEAMNNRLANGEMPDDICKEYFGLEPDYIMDLI